MADIPIIMSGPMVLSLLREIEKPGTGKTQTRRLAWGKPIFSLKPHPDWRRVEKGADIYNRPSPWRRVKPGDRLWVRESLIKRGNIWGYAADGVAIALPINHPRVPDMIAWAHHYDHDSAPSIHMPKRASRVTLHVAANRMERLNDISERDAVAEGLIRLPARRDGFGDDWHYRAEGLFYIGPSPIKAYADLWERLHGKASWLANPEVCALTFRPVLANIDAVEAQAA